MLNDERRLLLFVCVALILLTGCAVPVRADESEPLVCVILFYSPSCPHCHQVIDKVLLPLMEQYGEQLQIGTADTHTPEGGALYQAVVDHFQISPERQGVPALIIGDVVLVGSQEIPERLPGLIEQGLAAGGVDWPAIPSLVLPTTPTPEAVSTPVLTPAPDVTPLLTLTAQSTPSPGLGFPTDTSSSISEVIARDMPGNAISIGVLCGMVVSLGYVVMDGVRIWRKRKKLRRQKSPATRIPAWRDWAVLALCLLGLVVAGYLAYIETTLSEAVCGPIGDCNTVQQSEYALLFGLVPIAVFGVVGYVIILAVWAWGRLGRGRLAELAPLALLGLTLSGTTFSTYLTFLEPFVVGATCSWCLASAVSMTLLLLLVARQGWETLGREWLSWSARIT
jgi:uncharacterized membrane protein